MENILTNMLMPETKVFRDPIHNYIKVFHQVIYDLIDSSPMQRLRRIKQLGGTSLVYQTAEHSRFTHSLGVYEIVRQIVMEHEQLKNELNEYDKLTLMCAGLLHDIGHGPFSHAFEHVFNQDHEAYTIKMILQETEVHDILVNCHPNLPNDVAMVIEKTHPNKMLVQLISSQLDADRMDYLLRDSYFTGTTYGEYDIFRVLRTMRVQDQQVVFKASGVQAIENYILARYHMYWQVYFHPVARSYERLLIGIFKRMHYLFDHGYTFKTEPTLLYPILERRSLTCKEYLLLDEPIVQYYFTMFMQEEDPILSDLTSRFMNRQLFKYQPKSNVILEEDIKNELIKAGFDPEYYLQHDDQIQIPYHYYGNKDGDILILNDDQSIIPLPSASEIVHAIVHSDKTKSNEMYYFPLLK